MEQKMGKVYCAARFGFFRSNVVLLCSMAGGNVVIVYFGVERPPIELIVGLGIDHLSFIRFSSCLVWCGFRKTAIVMWTSATQQPNTPDPKINKPETK